MAAGKSTVGPVLAAALARRFIDLDQMIAADCGCSVGALIARIGEDGFRHIETQALRTAAAGDTVIAPGGGAITRAKNRALMRQCGTTVWLDAPFELCWQRIKSDGVVRPLAPDAETARARYEQRLPLYRAAAVRVAIAEAAAPEQIAAAIIALL